MVFYENETDLHEKLLHYLEHDEERSQIAKKGWEKAHRSFSSEKVAQFIIEATFSDIQSEFDWPTQPIKG